MGPELTGVITKSLAKAPADRFGSAAALRDSLRTILHSIGSIADAAGPDLVPSYPKPPTPEKLGFLANLTARFKREKTATKNSVAVVPFVNLGGYRTARVLWACFGQRRCDLFGTVAIVVGSTRQFALYPHEPPCRSGGGGKTFSRNPHSKR